jgi:SAM-dependent methyltransferase
VKTGLAKIVDGATRSDAPDALYDRDYYEHGPESGKSLYVNYRWLPELTLPMCATLLRQLGIGHDETILDFGCAKGYMVRAFRLLGRAADGVDVSAYAIGCAPRDVAPYLRLIAPDAEILLPRERKYDWVMAKDVLEHVAYAALDGVLRRLRGACRRMFVAVPLGNNGRYRVPAYELDATHVIREDLAWWSKAFGSAGFSVASASYQFPGVKENYRRWPRGNGFFVLEAEGAGAPA